MQIAENKKIRRMVGDLLLLADITEPPIPVERIAELKGAKIKYVRHAGETSGLLSKEKGVITIGVNALHSKTRQRFTIAHELGHLMLGGIDRVHVDENFPILNRDERSSQAIDPAEISANAFAAELLMPTTMLDRDTRGKIIDHEDDELVLKLAARYKVSPLAMTIRLMNFSRALQK